MQTINDSQRPLNLDLVLGADALAVELGMTKRQVYHAAASGYLPTFKIGSAICARRSTIKKWITQQERAAGIEMDDEADN